MGLRIQLIGPPEIVDAAGQRRSVRGFQAWALLARLVLAERPPTRRELSAELFPDTTDPLGSLRWCLAGLRRAVGSSESFSGDPLRLDLPADVEVDVWELLDGRFDVTCAGELLESVDPRCSPELDTWLLVQRQRVAGLIDAQIRSEVMIALSVGEHDRALSLAEQGARRAPLDEGAHVRLIKSLMAAGHEEAATTHLEHTEAVLRAELGIEPSAALRSAARRHVADPPRGVSGRARAASLLESGLAAVAAGAVDAGLDCLRRACGDAEASGDDQLLARCLFELGSGLVHAVRSHDDEGALLLQSSVALAEGAGDARTAAAACRELGYVDALAGRRPAAAAHLERGRAFAGEDAELLAGVHAVIAFNLTDWGRLEAGVAEHRRALELARAAGNPRREAWTLGLGGWAHLLAGDPGMARRWLDDCLGVVSELRWVAFRPWALAVLAEVDLLDHDDPDRVRAGLEETFALSCQLADPCWEGAAARSMALSCAAGGRLDEALGWISQANGRCRRETDAFVGLQAAILVTDAELSRAAGQAERAEASARALVSLAARTHMDAYLDQGLAALDRTAARR